MNLTTVNTGLPLIQLPQMPQMPQNSNMKEDCSLFVGDLSFFCNESELYTAFSSFGSLTEVKICRSSNGYSLLYAFISFEHPHQALAAMHTLNGRELLGRRMR